MKGFFFLMLFMLVFFISCKQIDNKPSAVKSPAINHVDTLLNDLSLYENTDSIPDNSTVYKFSKKKAYVNYDADTVLYSLWMETDSTLFMVVRKIYVEDSCFGDYSNYYNYQRAWHFVKENGKPEYIEPSLRYSVSVQDSTGFKKMWDIDERTCDQIYYPVLESSAECTVNKKSCYRFLRVIEKETESLNIRCINFLIDNKNNWKVLSKEMITTDGQFDSYNGYCVDTVSKNLGYTENGIPKNNIVFLRAFDAESSHIEWICNKSLR